MIDVHDLTLRRGASDVLTGLGFRLAAGESLAILGANGIGKTTLLTALNGVLKPSRGRIAVQGRTGFVPQLFEVPFSYSALDIALMGRARHLGLFGAPGKRDFEIVRHYLRLLGIEDLEHRPFNALSGGQRQLVTIAQALASECDLLILDEPCAALDYRNQDKVLDLLALLRAEHGQTVVFSTHMPQHAVEVATHVLLLERADRHLFGPVAEVLTEANLSALYGLPIGRADFAGTGRHTFAPLFRDHAKASHA
ncbi:MAG: iron ABC transporter ATP-binding protein [Rhodobacteraceae bacterium]|nr:iron ABC transporter ATP-binding protein [Paracoccaceae bacterium]MAY43938.1 iron ABC transporter ATP-binding protein [Paracoccaceae bacterium]